MSFVSRPNQVLRLVRVSLLSKAFSESPTLDLFKAFLLLSMIWSTSKSLKKFWIANERGSLDSTSSSSVRPSGL